MKQPIVIRLLVLFILLTSCSQSKNSRVWTFHLKDIALDSLKANFIRNSYLNFNQEIYFERQDNGKWVITVPDSTFYDYDLLSLSAYQQGKGWNEVMLLDSPKIVDYNAFNVLFFCNKKTVTLEASPFSYQEENSIYLKTAYMDTEYRNGKNMADLKARINRKQLSQKQAVDSVLKYIELTPNSYAIVKKIRNFLSYDIDLSIYKKIYASFDPELRNTPSGRMLDLYIKNRAVYEASDEFLIFDLPRCDNNELEPFIQADGKYKLILFSSYGCGPCHEAIPIYKQIYNDLSDKIDIIYISIDTKNTIKYWNEILEKYGIPWQSYFSYNIDGGILQKYMLTSVPNSILVYPDLSFEKIDAREEADRMKLYRLAE